MGGRPPPQRPEPSYDAVRIGNPVSSMYQWMQMGALSNWLNGCGAQIVPGVVVDRAIPSGANRTLRFRARTRIRTIEYVWCFLLRSVDAGASVIIDTGGAEGPQLYALNSGRDTRLPIIHRHYVTPSAAITEFSVNIESQTGVIDIDTVSVTELHRPVLNQDGSEIGIDTNTLRPRERLYSSLTVGESATGVVTGMYGDYRKSGILQWAVPSEDPVIVGKTVVNLFSLAQPVLGPKLGTGATTAQVYWSVYARVSGGSASVTVSTTHSAVSDALTVSNTGAFAWSTPRAINIDCEKMTADDGRQATTWDDLQISINGGSLSGSPGLEIATFSLWNEAI